MARLTVSAGALLGLLAVAFALRLPVVRGQMAGMPPAGGWKPTDATAATQYIGRAVCAECHQAQSASHPHTGMAGAAQPVEDCDILREYPLLTFATGAYRYRIERKGKRSDLTVTDGKQTIEAPLAWCFGKGEAGQTYIFERNGRLHESRVSFYLALKSLDLTMGAPTTPPASLEEAAGRPMPDDDARDCFGCHTTGSVRDGRLALDRLLPGVTCEGCHGPGGGHVQAVKAGRLGHLEIRTAQRTSAEEQSAFCGSCHRTWPAVMMQGLRGVANVRFQPYRIANSRCYDADDGRIACTSCHDVHAARERDAAAYDEKCQACHAGAATTGAGKKGARECPTGKTACASCHMPRFEIPGSHFAFTDHQIRVHRPGDRYPD